MGDRQVSATEQFINQLVTLIHKATPYDVYDVGDGGVRVLIGNSGKTMNFYIIACVGGNRWYFSKWYALFDYAGIEDLLDNVVMDFCLEMLRCHRAYLLTRNDGQDFGN